VIPGLVAIPPLRREVGATYVGGQRDFSTSSTLSTLGAASGDLLIVYDSTASGNINLSSGNSVTDITNGFYTRVLNSSDVAGTVSSALSRPLVCVIYHGAASAAVVDSDTSSGAASSKDAGGYTKNGAHYGMLAVIVSQTVSATLSVGSPPTFTSRISGELTGVATKTVLVTDRLQPANPYYISGTSVLWNSSGSNNGLAVLELRS
jgi:hypothetical protein